jgi:polysaccharide export outer membrane protein
VVCVKGVHASILWVFRAPTGSLAFAVALAGCTSLALPASGPQSWDVKSGQNLDLDGLQFAYVRVTPDTMRVRSRVEPLRLAGAFTLRKPVSKQTFQVGDVVSVTVFEASAGGLFIPSEAGVRPGNFVGLPDQSVDSKGNITVPYPGAVRATGRTLEEIQAEIVDKLKDRAIEPQVVVSFKNQAGGLVSVLGEVNAATRFAASPDGEKVLDAITRAGGIKGQGWDLHVTLERGGRRETVPFGNLIEYPANNVFVQPRDNVYVGGLRLLRPSARRAASSMCKAILLLSSSTEANRGRSLPR